MPMHYAGIFKGCKNDDFKINNIDIFFLPNAYIVGTRFLQVPTINVLEQK